ncbi:MAG: hypothetical protein ABI867_31190 [Kofleriaceae bacterium]
MPAPTASLDSAARPTLTWSTTATGDAVFIEADYSAGEAGTFDWNIVAPANPGTLQFPELPADLVPPGHAVLSSVGLLEASAFAGYDDVRAKLQDLFRKSPAPGDQFRISTLVK